MSLHFEVEGLVPELLRPGGLAKLDARFRKTLERLTSQLDAETLLRSFGHALKRATSFELQPVLLDGLEKIVEIQAARERNATLLLPLRERTLQIQHSSAIELSMDGAVLAQLAIDVRVELTFKSGLLEMEAGRIRGLQPWATSAKAVVGIDGEDLYARDLWEFKLPGRIEFGIEPAPPTEKSLRRALARA